MKVLNVIMSFDPVTGGGSVERTFQMSRHLVKAGIECGILTTNIGLTQERVNSIEGVKLIALPSLFKRFYVPKCSYLQLKQIVNCYDIIHLMNHWTLINVLVYRAVKQLAKPYAVCPAGALPVYGRSRGLKKLYNHLIGRKIIRQADGHIAISPVEIKQYESYGVHAGQVSLIPNGINPDDFPDSDGKKFRTRYGIGDAPLILFIGRLNSIKGPDMLLEAFRRCNQEGRLHEYHLVFAGPDEGMRKGLNRVALESGLNDRVHFTGHISGAEKSDAYRAADFLVIPSRQEAMSIVVLEAGITRTPVLITDQCGFNEVAAVTGGMVVEASIEGLQKGLLSMSSDPETLEIMGQNLGKFTREHFLWDHIVNRYLELFSRIMN